MQNKSPHPAKLPLGSEAGPAAPPFDPAAPWSVQIICQPACKPGFVWPGTCAPNVAAIHLGKALPPSSCNLPGHSGRKGLLWFPKARCPYSVLLPAGFAVPLALPLARWALTPPFHPYPEFWAVRSLWHFPWGRPRRPLAGAVFPWSPDFPHCPPFGRWTMRPPGQLAPPLNGVRIKKARKSSETRREFALPSQLVWTFENRSGVDFKSMSTGSAERPHQMAGRVEFTMGL